MSSRKKLGVGYVTAKRSFDILVSCVFLLPSIVIAGTSALFVVLIDKQNPFFVQKRTVNNDQIFDTYKIRTMKNGIITQLGSILRKFSMDEIPQIYNVLKGDMSLVGPRPCSLGFYRNEDIKGSSSTPGLTGLLQIQDNHKDLGVHNINIYNRMYDIKKSFSLDIYILFKTIPKVILGKNK